MEIAAMICSFVAALIVSTGIVVVFSDAIDAALFAVMTGDFGEIWARYTKFGLLVAGLVSGIRAAGFESLTAGGGQAAGVSSAPLAVTAGRAVFEVLRTVVGSLEGLAWTLLVVFGAALAVYAGRRIYGEAQETLGRKEMETARQPQPQAQPPEQEPAKELSAAGRTDRPERKHGGSVRP